jgi:hypothetical protein
MMQGIRTAVGGLVVVAVLGAGNAAAQDGHGEIIAWGWNHYGSCNVPSPNTGFVAVAAGDYHSLGLKADGSIATWGLNNWGQCTVPPPNTGFVAVRGGEYHSLGLKAYRPVGDLNCDGRVDFGDINPFVLALTNWGQYLQQYPDCDIYLADINGDGFVDFGDINPFVRLLAGG